MTTINTSNTVRTIDFNNASAASNISFDAMSPSQKLAAIDSKFPNLDADLSKARAELEDVQGSDKWEGLKWFEKAIFFLATLRTTGRCSDDEREQGHDSKH